MGIISVLFKNVYGMSTCIMLQLFTGGMSVPVMTGYMLASVPPKFRTLANSLANMFYNLLGFFPAPSIYGLVYQQFGSGTNRWGLAAL